MRETLDKLNAALQIAGARLIEAERERKVAQDAADRAWTHRRQCYKDVETLLKAIRDLTGDRGQHTVWLSPDGLSSPPSLISRTNLNAIDVHVSGHKVSLKRVAAVCRRIGTLAGLPAVAGER